MTSEPLELDEDSVEQGPPTAHRIVPDGVAVVQFAQHISVCLGREKAWPGNPAETDGKFGRVIFAGKGKKDGWRPLSNIL